MEERNLGQMTAIQALPATAPTSARRRSSRSCALLPRVPAPLPPLAPCGSLVTFRYLLYSIMHMNRNRRNPLKTNNPCTLYSKTKRVLRGPRLSSLGGRGFSRDIKTRRQAIFRPALSAVAKGALLHSQQVLFPALHESRTTSHQPASPEPVSGEGGSRPFRLAPRLAAPKLAATSEGGTVASFDAARHGVCHAPRPATII